MLPPIAVVGIGADGWGGLTTAAQDAISAAHTVHGSPRQLALIPDHVTAERHPWPSPMMPALPTVIAEHRPARMCVLASGDPMFFGIGVTLARTVGAANLRVFPHVSSASLACARLGWALQSTPVVSVVNRAVETVLPELSEGRKLLVLSESERTPAVIAQLLHEHGWHDTDLTVLEQLGGPGERIITGTAHTWTHPPGDPLNVVAIECRTAAQPRLTRTPGLADSNYGTDGQLTKNEMRALTLSALAPAPGELLWDVGAGSGSIGIEWMRTHPDCVALAFETDSERHPRIVSNAARLGVPGLRLLGRAPESFPQQGDNHSSPDAIMVGGAVTQPGLLDACWQRLTPGGRMVVNAVTAESEALLLSWHQKHGGDLRKLQVYRAGALGGFTAWRPHLPAVQWKGTKA
ncbi:precorrin-6y C5,15-methyltransferase (decarboxylating) subunit CbiE [Hoyosella rhizosphaerae]|uniref:precorrin-6y C5,15-methyltransferase (decarboxylating) subunit CbiE n=1 Tax=Hoyosella rhizosphaerae TaxID=1755582 RepID=UPI0016667C16|nr:precorrin-6y C5,15-methyltransferase (decarboxylating) subunit CbiE [Hoyosella rhizosphaerae]MBN4927069.1 precorrin-6y C5,15-methyltransferase (decarboxylating) subunit CbiE [Hoyosella rhizosphaerae]